MRNSDVKFGRSQERFSSTYTVQATFRAFGTETGSMEHINDSAIVLAEKGFVTLSTNVPYWGGSSGEPRNAVSPEIGPFIISAAKIDPRLKAIATSSMYDMGAINRNGLRQAQTQSERWNETDGGATRLTGGTPQAITNESTAIDREFFDFYRTARGEFTPNGSLPTLTTYPTLLSNVKFMNFYPFNDVDTISPRPMLFISGDQAHSREFSENAYARAAEPKELYWVLGAGHVDLYDRVQLIPFDKLTQFFRLTLEKF
ncbi:hypothetical protein BKA63DRAFT_528786 [Paraphoma chrysanthemicola]|nr:hypothetical protein BKA63DRAFT_528786 [Paraphoma chrysanthemicola]